MSVYNVERRVDTFIMEVDLRTAEKLLALVVGCHDQTRMPGDLTEFAIKVSSHLNYPDEPTFLANDGDSSRLTTLTDNNAERKSTCNRKCESLDASTRHYLNCPAWGFNND